MADDRLESLLAALEDPQTREEAVKELAALGDPRAVEALGNVLRSREGGGHALAYRVRQLAAEALGTLNDPAAVPPLITALQDDNARVRLSAAQALGTLGDRRAIEPLTGLLSDGNPQVRAAGIHALAATGTTQLEADLPQNAMIALLADPEDYVRKAAFAALETLGGQAVPLLIDALRHPNSTIRGAAADLLGQFQDERARGPLRDIAYVDNSKWVRSRAQAALKQFPPGEDDGPLARRNVSLEPPPDTIQLVRSQGPAWPSLRGERPPAQPPPAMPDPAQMNADQVRQILDQIDIRLANGEITEETYRRLVERWEARLRELGE
jgi:HEAT repeat protein